MKLNTFGGHRDTSTSRASDRAGFLKELHASVEIAERFECDQLIVFSDGIQPAIAGSDPPIMPAMLKRSPPRRR